MVDAPLILSKSAFAARRGVAVSAVSKWLSRGRLVPPALTADGRIDVAEAERQLGSSLDLSRSLGKSAAAAPAPAAAAGGDLDELRGIKLEQARRNLQRDREADLERRGRYVLADDSRRAFTREAAQLIATIEQRLPELVAQLGGGKAEVVLARNWLRSLRQHETATIRERAKEMPEFVVDHAAEPELAYAS